MRRACPSIVARMPLWLVAAGVSLAIGGCASCRKSATSPAPRDDLALLPRASNIVAQLQVKKLRPTPIWTRITDLAHQTPEQKARYAEFVKETGLDPLKQIDSVLVALPSTGTGGGDFAVVLRGGPFAESKLVAYLTTKVKEDGGEITTSDYQGRKRYTDGKSGTTFAHFADPSTLVLASDAWSKQIIDLASKPGDNARANAELMAVVKKTRTDDAVWGAGLVSEEGRARLGQNEQLKSAGSMKSMHFSADFVGGLQLASVVELGGAADAGDLATRLKDQIAQSRQNPRVQIMGLGRYFDALKVSSEGAALRLDIKLEQRDLDDLIERAAVLLKGLGGGLGAEAAAGEEPGAAAPDPSPDPTPTPTPMPALPPSPAPGAKTPPAAAPAR